METFVGPFLFLPFFGWAGCSRTGNCHTDRGGRACRDRGLAKRRTIVAFGLYGFLHFVVFSLGFCFWL